MVGLSSFAKYAASARAALTSRDAASTQQNLETINTALEKLTSTVKAYTGGVLAAASISSNEAAVGQDIKNGIADAKASEVVTDEEATALITYIRTTLEPNIRACMDALKEKKEKLAAAGLKGTVQGDVADMRAQTNALGAELVNKAPAPRQQEAKEVLAAIDTVFQDAITFFA